MAFNDALLDYIKSVLSSIEGFHVRKMFGGAGLYIDSTIFGIVYETEMYLKTDSFLEKEFISRGMGRFHPYTYQRASMPYFEVPGDVLEDEDELIRWSKRSYEAFR